VSESGAKARVESLSYREHSQVEDAIDQEDKGWALGLGRMIENFGGLGLWRLSVFFLVRVRLWEASYDPTHCRREAFTYRQGHGDKESWWFGFELAATPYTMEGHYGAIVDHSQNTASRKRTRVCSFTIGHVNHNNKLLWYNGSLLKNKEIDPNDFEVPTEWMIDGV
jgi:Mannosyltransferase putative